MTLAERIYVAMIEAELGANIDADEPDPPDRVVLRFAGELARSALEAERVFRRAENDRDLAAGPLPEPGPKPRPSPTTVPGPGVRHG